MKVLIIEDEKPAAAMLELLLQQMDPPVEVVKTIASVKESIDWISSNSQLVDLIFMDIQLTDGLSFEIFKQVEIVQPIIFTTAFNEYAIEAFRVNSIDYLLKPIKADDLSRSLNKLKMLREPMRSAQNINYETILKALTSAKQSYLTRIMVKVGDHIKAYNTADIALFYADGRTVYLYTKEKKRYVVDYTLDNLASTLDPDCFFRCNRSLMININAIVDAVVYSSTRLKIRLNIEFDDEVIISRERVAPFKKWFAGIRE
jgi:DNA-binding LytR/AlgR family response regulator